MRRTAIVLMMLVLTLTGCWGESDDEDGEQEPEATAVATATPEPSPTPTPSPTPSPTPTQTATPTPEPTATPVPERSTLTGEPIEEPAQRPVAVKIDNSPQARPHTGIAKADLVYESPTEAGVTRFVAMYQTSAPEVVGPVRSARLTDLQLVPLHDAMLAYSGASIGVSNRLYEHGLDLLMVEGNAASAGWRDNSRFSPHNLFTSIPALRDIANQLGYSREAQNEPFTFGEPPDRGAAGQGVVVPFDAGRVRFEYNAETDSYDRFVDGAEHQDAETGATISPRNAVVIQTEFFIGDVAPNTRGEVSNNAVLQGSGSAWVLRNGERYDVEWRRDGLHEPFRFYDRESGEEIPLAEGKSWICIVPLNIAPEFVE